MAGSRELETRSFPGTRVDGGEKSLLDDFVTAVPVNIPNMTTMLSKSSRLQERQSIK